MNKNRKIAPSLLGFFIATAMSAQTPVEKTEKDEIKLDYRQLERSGQPSTRIDKPTIALPEGLEIRTPSRVEVASPEADKGEDKKGPQAAIEGSEWYPQGRPPGAPDPAAREREIRQAASRAAEWTATRLVEESAAHEYYKVGLWDGLNRALRGFRGWNPDYGQGQSDGRRDFRAERMGEEIGERAARERAPDQARAAVEAEFRDLDNEPRRRLPIPSEPMPAGEIRISAPRLEDVFATAPLRPYLRHYRLDPVPDPWRLSQHNRWGDVYDNDWLSERRAFDLWRRHGDSRFFETLSESERGFFRRVFVAELNYFVGEKLERIADRAYRHGFDDGWDYGCFVGAEWSYRQGYHEAFAERVARQAEDVFAEAYRDFFSRAFAEEFDRWSSSARPEIVGFEIEDGDHDGVISPGEEIWLALRVANFGGSAGRFEVDVDGRDLERPGRSSLELRRRALAEVPALSLRVSPRAIPRRATELQAQVGPAQKAIPLTIAWPFELDRAVRLVRQDSLDGRISLEVGARNISRRALEGEVEVLALGRSVASKRLELEPGGQTSEILEIDGLPTIDLLADQLTLVIEARRGTRLEDVVEHRLPALGLDLGRDDLDVFWAELVAGRRELSTSDLRRAEDILVERLGSDWQRARETSGNPYRQDLERGSRATALGNLVATINASGRPRRPELVDRLERRLDQLAEDLPGSHPFLRSAFKKLVAQLGR